MKRYSEFINFPIYLWATKEVETEVPADDDESSDSSDEEEICMWTNFDFFEIFPCLFFLNLQLRSAVSWFLMFCCFVIAEYSGEI